MSSTSFSANSIDTDARGIDITPRSSASRTFTKKQNGDLLHPKPKAFLTRHCTSLQEHADHLNDEESPADNGGLTPRNDSRQDGFTWGLSPTYEDQRTHNRDPLPPEQLGARTPPPLEVLLRRPTNELADSAHNNRLPQVDTFDFQPTTARLYNASTIRNTPSHHDTGRSPITGFARGLTRHIPDMRMFPPPEPVVDDWTEQRRRRSRSESSAESHQGGKKERKLSFVLRPSLKQKESYEAPQKRVSIAEGSASESNANRNSVPSSTGSSLRERRRVNLDLSLPAEIPDIPARSRSPIVQLSSITPSRPRSPKTPWIRNESPKWQHSLGAHTVPIMGKDYISEANVEEGNEKLGLLPGNDPITSSQSPKFDRSPHKIRDRCYTSRPRSRRSRSGRSGTSESTLARTPDRSWIPDDPKALQEQQARTDAELQQLGQASKIARSSRWRWARSTARSSDEVPQTSISPFKRSNRIADQFDKHKEKTHLTSSSRAWWIGKQTATQQQFDPQSALSNMPLPPAFVPPGLNRVPTPPIFDANGEVKGKLADFFFDHGAGTEGRKSKSSPEGYWDSDALLMSYLSSDMNLEDEDEDEGPEGPLTLNPAARAFTVDRNPSYGTPGLVAAPGGYLDAQSVNHSQHPGQSTASPDVQDLWFRIQQDETPNKRQFTALALREIDERRKFEWIVPEHLPNSPLCPLHPRYQGYSAGLCYWHGRRKSNGSRNRASGEYEGGIYETGKRERTLRKLAEQTGDGVEYPAVQKGSRGWEVGKVDVSPNQSKEAKKRRLESLSSP